ncbi:hypothetical protein BC832DRAFT_564800 [Gaertneriomyces semiglobifer]|nr:hypothetical protein BC832DRAFT_564800 [Gaertneriomyces semiglobifer]
MEEQLQHVHSDGKKQHGKRRGRLSNVLHFRRKHSKKDPLILSINTSVDSSSSSSRTVGTAATALAAEPAENNTALAEAHNNHINNSSRREVWQEAIRRLSSDQQQHRSSSEGSKTLANSCHQLSPISPTEEDTSWHDDKDFNKHSSLHSGSGSLSSSPSEDSVFPRRRFSGTSIYTTATHRTHYDPYYPYPVYASVDAQSYPSTLDSTPNVKISLWRNRPSAVSIRDTNNQEKVASIDAASTPIPPLITTTTTHQYPLGLDLHRRSFSSSRRSLELDHTETHNKKRLSASSTNSRAAKDKLDALMGTLGPYTDSIVGVPHYEQSGTQDTHRDSVKRLSQALDRVQRVSLDLSENHTSMSEPYEPSSDSKVVFPTYTAIVYRSGVDVDHYEMLSGRFFGGEDQERRGVDGFERVLEAIEKRVLELGGEKTEVCEEIEV